MQILRTAQATEWLKVMARCSGYDVGHLPAYHLVAEQNGEGEARLFVYEGGGHTIALPLLLREIDSFGELPPGQWRDATSVYGYAGPVISSEEIPESEIKRFQEQLRAALRQERVISVFSRFHPLLAQKHIFSGLGECVPVGQTVSIDLTLPESVQLKAYRRDLRKGLLKLQEAGARCVYDPSKNGLDCFIKMYRETMCRVSAEAFYLFDDRYFENLISELGSNLHLFTCLLDDIPVAAMLVSACSGMVQTYLSASADEHMKLAPTKLVFETVRSWGARQGFKVLHLGGGVGAKSDSLFYFKAGFSDRRHEFLTWRWVLEPEPYEAVCAAKRRWNAQQSLKPSDRDYFPEYRSPAVPDVGECLEERRTVHEK